MILNILNGTLIILIINPIRNGDKITLATVIIEPRIQHTNSGAIW